MQNYILNPFQNAKNLKEKSLVHPIHPMLAHKSFAGKSILCGLCKKDKINIS
jgi:uncharacterized CHY-type Zn-finger protein